MPFYHFFGDFEDDFNQERDEPGVPGAFEYESASTQFDAEKLSGLPALALELLKEAGVTEMRFLYDGGSDEGFAHADDMWIDGERKSLDEVIDTLSTPTNVERIRACALGEGNSYWHNAGEHYGKKEPSK